MRLTIGCMTLRCLCLLLAFNAVSGCAQQPEVEIAEDDRDAVLMLLERIDERRFHEAFAALDHMDHRRHVRIRQFDRDGNTIAMRRQDSEMTFRNGTPVVQVLEESAEGDFDFGIFGRFVPEEFGPDLLPNIARELIPEQPAFLGARAYEDFIYVIAADTLVAGDRLSVIDVRARPGAEDDYNVARVRYFYDAETNELRRLDQWRRYDAFLLNEMTHSTFEITREGERYVPYRIGAVTSVRAPFVPRRSFEAQILYSFGGEPAPGV